ncbi:MAG TPA: arginine--tRNA ligase, partial [bacterium]|nr:arginine--tRNA ligase [bacterium]
MKSYLEQQLHSALKALAIASDSEIIFTKTKDERFGNVATNLAMNLAKTQKMNPRELAQKIVDHL